MSWVALFYGIMPSSSGPITCVTCHGRKCYGWVGGGFPARSQGLGMAWSTASQSTGAGGRQRWSWHSSYTGLRLSRKGKSACLRAREGTRRTMTESDPTRLGGLRCPSPSHQEGISQQHEKQQRYLVQVNMSPTAAATSQVNSGQRSSKTTALACRRPHSRLLGQPPPPSCPSSDLKPRLATMLGIHLVAGFHISDLS